MTISGWRSSPPAARMLADYLNKKLVYDSTLECAVRCEACPLSRVKAGVTVRIKQLCASPEVQDRLREIGLCEEQIIKLLTSHTGFICQVCNARLAISEQLAQVILVEPVVQPVIARPILH